MHMLLFSNNQNQKQYFNPTAFQLNAKLVYSQASHNFDAKLNFNNNLTHIFRMKNHSPHKNLKNCNILK